MSIELTVTVKDSDRTLKKEFLVYEPITFVDTDPMISRIVKESLEEFKGEPDDIKIRAVMILK